MFSLPGSDLVSIDVVLAMGVLSLISRVLCLTTGVVLARLRPDDEVVVTWLGIRIVPHPTHLPTQPMPAGEQLGQPTD